MATAQSISRGDDGDTLVIVATWIAKPGRAEEMAALEDRSIAAAGSIEGNLSATVLREPGSDEFHFVHTFATDEAMDAWINSPERRELVAELGRYGSRQGDPQRITGLEGWFTSMGSGTRTIKPPPRWKMWLASLLGAYPLVILFQWLLAPEIAGLPLLLRSAVFPLIILSVMTYAMMPLVTRVLHPWLFGDRAG